jgi:hypothetical protein
LGRSGAERSARAGKLPLSSSPPNNQRRERSLRWRMGCAGHGLVEASRCSKEPSTIRLSCSWLSRLPGVKPNIYWRGRRMRWHAFDSLRPSA